MKFIVRDFPSMAPKFEKLYARKYPPDAYRKEVQGMVKVLQARYGLGNRDRGSAALDEFKDVQEPEQIGFRF